MDARPGIGIPPTLAIWALVIVLFAIFLHRTRLGRNLFATGANPRAADYALINTRRVWMAAFAFSAVTSTLVGILIGGFAGQVAHEGQTLSTRNAFGDGNDLAPHLAEHRRHGRRVASRAAGRPAEVSWIGAVPGRRVMGRVANRFGQQHRRATAVAPFQSKPLP